MAIKVQIPALGESVTEVVLLKWLKAEGDEVALDEPICELETDKANVSLPSPATGKIHHSRKEGDTLKIGEVVAEIAPSDGKAAAKAPAKAAAPAPQTSAPTDATKGMSPSVRQLVREHDVDPASVQGSGPHGRVTKEDVLSKVAPAAKAAPEKPAAPAAGTKAPPPVPRALAAGEGVRREPMTKIRKKIAERLVNAQHQAAMLTTFNEIDMGDVLALRERFKARFQEKYGVSLGLTSFFARASALALIDFPIINASIEGEDIVYHDYVHLAIAVSTDRGLVVPVLRNAHKMSFATVESEIKRLSNSAREGKLGIDELTGGTFTITNGGVFGSLMSTPILNPPQSAILGLHATQKRPVVRGESIVIRPMMYVALSYDHRLIDGKDSVSYLVRVKEYMEDPARLMLEV